MPKLLRFADGQLRHSGSNQIFIQRAVNRGRGHQIFLRDVQIAVIFHHAGVFHLRARAAVKMLEIVIFKRVRDFNGAVAAEVEKDHTVAVHNRPGGLAVCLNDKRRQVLVNDAGLFIAEGFNRLAGGSKEPPLALHMGLPAQLHHAPVGIIAVHRDHHASTARCDQKLSFAFGILVLEKGLDVVNVIQCGSQRDIAPVQKRMQAYARDPLHGGLGQHGLELIHMAVNIAVGQEPDEMQSGLVGLAVCDEIFPDRALENAARGDRVVHQLGALIKHPAAADRVVADFAVAHVPVGGKADSAAVSLELRIHCVGLEPVHRRRGSRADKIALFILPNANAVHDHQHDRTGRPRELVRFLQCFHISPVVVYLIEQTICTVTRKSASLMRKRTDRSCHEKMNRLPVQGGYYGAEPSNPVAAL